MFKTTRGEAEPIEIQVPTDMPCLKADPWRLQQVLAHLLSNVFFFYPCGDRRDLHSFPTRRSSDLLSGILNWAIAGLRAWRKEGLGEPRHVIRATKAYREEQDVFGSFLDERCDVGEGEW